MAEKLPELVDLKLSKSEKKEAMEVPRSSGPTYPYGLCLDLNEDTLEKLGIKDLPGVGDEMHFIAVAHVTSARSSEYEESGLSKSICLQISDMAIIKREKASEDSPNDSAHKESKEDDAAVQPKRPIAVRP